MSRSTAALRSFRPGWAPTLAAALAVAILASLGAWQVRRHHWREADLAQRRARIALPPLPLESVLADPLAAEGRRASLRGEYDHPRSIAVVRVPRALVEGARILTPLRLADGRALVVDRGWVPYTELERFLEDPPPRERGQVEVTGLVFALRLDPVEPGSAAVPRREWVRFDPTRPGHPTELQSQLPYRLVPVLVQREDGSGEYPLGEIAQPTSPVDHVQYAITWFSLAAIALATWIGLGIVQGREARRDAA